MKRIILLGAALLIASSAAAQQTNQSDSTAGATAAVVNNSKSHRNVSSAIAPSYSSGVDCNGTGIGIAHGVFGISLGMPSSGNSNCDVREDSKYILALTGDKEATKERLCDNRRIRAAFARANRPCVGDSRRVSTRTIATRSTSVGSPRVRASAQAVDSNNVKLAACMRRAQKDESIRCTVYQ